MDGYMKDPHEMDDKTLLSWIKNFEAQPPTMDNFQESMWAGRVYAEWERRLNTVKIEIRAEQINGRDFLTTYAQGQRVTRSKRTLASARKEAEFLARGYRLNNHNIAVEITENV
jgi:hypothetical protein